MKIFKNKKETKKSWCIKLIDGNSEEAFVCAVDSENGNIICTLIGFYDDGNIIPILKSKNVFENYGYDPFEHNNKFDKHGCIVVKR